MIENEKTRKYTEFKKIETPISIRNSYRISFGCIRGDYIVYIHLTFGLNKKLTALSQKI